MQFTFVGEMKNTLSYWILFFLALAGAGLVVLHANARATSEVQSGGESFKVGGLRSFEIVPLETVSETSSNASVGDLNGDGNLDIVLVKGRHWQITSKIFFGDGQGHFTPGPALPSKATKSYSASLADMTKNGHLDMVLSNDQPDPKLILLNDGKGNFTIGGTYGDPNWSTRNAAVGDLNGDGYPDIAVANREMASYVCFNDGRLHFDCRPLEDSPSAATVAIADINGDGANDVIYACRDSCQNLVYFNDGKGGFASKKPWGPPKSSTRAMAVADFDGDGHLDIAACHEQLGCFVYLNDGKGNFGSGIQIQTPGALPYSMIAADLNRDHRPEIIVGYVDAPGVIFFNDGTGKKYQPVPFGDGKGSIYGMAVGDLNGDGWPDVVVARSDAPCFVMFNRPATPSLSNNSSVQGQDPTLQHSNSPNDAAPLLWRVEIKHHGFDDADLNDTTMNDLEAYLEKHLEDRPRSRRPYDQKKVEAMKNVLESFWKERGIAVEVRAGLTPIQNKPGYAILEFDVYKLSQSNKRP